MAAVRPAHASEGRVPCPACGGLIHPVAGRCKHCKQDVAALRAGGPRPELAIVLPRPPPRPLVTPPPEPSIWRHWPIAVMVLAVVAILLALAVLAWPRHEPDARKPPPRAATERMNTDPLPPPQPQPPPQPPSASDPWGPNGAPAAPGDPDPAPDPGGLGQLGPLALPSSGSFMIVMAEHLCDRFHQCGTSNDFIDMYCTGVRSMQQQGAPAASPTCPEAERCLHTIDRMSCTARTDDAAALSQLLMQFPDCLDAMTRC